MEIKLFLVNAAMEKKNKKKWNRLFESQSSDIRNKQPE